MKITVNGAMRDIDLDPETPLLFVLRDELKLTGTKFGCGIGACGACTVHVDGVAERSCTLAVGDVVGASVTTIDGLGADKLHKLQNAWIKHDVPQCGYCQPGFIMAAASEIAANPSASANEVLEAITNICRCGTYDRIRAAVTDVVEGRGQ